MWVGVGRVALALEGVSSLKDKRAIVRRLVERARHRFNAAVAEVEAQEVRDRAVLGFAVLSNEGAHCDRMLEEIAQWIEGSGLAPVLWRKSERVAFGGLAGRRPEQEGVLGSWGTVEESG